MLASFVAAFVLAIIVSPAAVVSPSPGVFASPSPGAIASPLTSTHHSLTLAIPPGWRRTESGQYNEWLSPDGLSDFRVAIMGATPDYHGPNAAEAVRAAFQAMSARFNPKVQITVQTIHVCNGEQAAYRVDDPLGVGSPAFMVIIPGTDSSGLINYEVRRGGKVDPVMLQAIDKICWP